MANRIVVSTDRLDDWASRLGKVESIMDDVAATLRRVDINAGGAGDQRMRWSMNLRSCDRSLRGTTIADSLDALIDGVRSLENALNRTERNTRDAARRFERAENSNRRGFESSDRGAASGIYGSGNAASFLASYTIRYRNPTEVLNRNRSAWEAEDKFIGTQYNQDLIRRLRETILNDPAFSEASWKQCTTDAQKETFIRAMYGKIEGVYQTKLSQEILFVYDEDFVETKEIIFGITYEKEVNTASVSLKNGKTVDISDIAVGGYYSTDDVIIINPDLCQNFEDIVGTLCHENRHNLQTEIVSATDLDKYDGVNGEDYNRIVEYRKEWNSQIREGNYYSFDTDDVKAREKQIKKEMDFTQWIQGEKKNAYSYAYSELYERYAEQQIEVDARYVEEYALQCVRQRAQTDAARSRSAGI